MDVLTWQVSSVADAIRSMGVAEVIIISGVEMTRRAPACLVELPPTRARGVGAGVCRVAGSASWIRFSGHA
jgi:hypothetical protein